MARALFASKLGTDPQAQGWRVDSAGTRAIDGLPASEFSQLVIRAWGLDLSGHLSKQVSGELLDSFDLILTMEANHKEALAAEFPHLAGQIHLLSEMADGQGDVEDPIGGPPEEYEATAREIDHLLNRGFRRILQLSKNPPQPPA
jgi:protein-tyrosine-phosphatase